jgi:hypothetical protein
MFLRLSKAAVAAISLLAALPAMAGDIDGYRHHGFHGRPGISINARPNLHPRAVGFTGFGDGYRHRGHGRSLREIYSPRPRYVSNTIIVAPQANGANSDGYYGGSGYAYQANGGTYVAADGYAPYRMRHTENLAPKAKVIDVAVADDPCSYEANVCVIRP